MPRGTLLLGDPQSGSSMLVLALHQGRPQQGPLVPLPESLRSIHWPTLVSTPISPVRTSTTPSLLVTQLLCPLPAPPPPSSQRQHPLKCKPNLPFPCLKPVLCR